MLWTIAIILALVWVIGLTTSVSLGGFIHLLIVAAIVLIAYRLIRGRRPATT